MTNKFQIPVPIKLLIICFTGFLFIKGVGVISTGKVFKGMVFPPNARKSDNVEDKRKESDQASIPMPSPSITIPPTTEIPNANAPEKPSNESTPVPNPVPSPSTLPIPNDQTEANQSIPVGLPIGVINGPYPDPDGWNIRSCPSLNNSCVNWDHVVYSGEKVNVYLNKRSYNDGVAWIKVYSPRLNYSGWIAINGVSVL